MHGQRQVGPCFAVTVPLMPLQARVKQSWLPVNLQGGVRDVACLHLENRRENAGWFVHRLVVPARLQYDLGSRPGASQIRHSSPQSYWGQCRSVVATNRPESVLDLLRVVGRCAAVATLPHQVGP